MSGAARSKHASANLVQAAVVVALSFLLLLHAGPTQASNADPVEALLVQSRSALGGHALNRAHVLRIVANVSIGGLSGTETSWREIGRARFAETSVIASFNESDGYDGDVVWNEDDSGLVWEDGGATGRAQEIALAFVNDDLLWAPARGGAVVAWGGTRSAAGHDFDALIITPRGAVAPFELWFDRQTHLPTQLVQRIGPNVARTSFSDYRPVDGVMTPYRVHSVDLQGNESDSSVVSAAVETEAASARLRRPTSNVHDYSIAGGAQQTAVAMELVDNHVYVPVMLNGRGPYRFIFDTGGQNVVDSAVAQEIGATGSGSLLGGGAGSATQALSIARVEALQIGAATIRNQLFAIAPVRAGFGVAAGQAVDGLIGFEVLARFVTTFDYSNSRVTLRLPGNRAASARGETIPFVFEDRQPQFACVINTVPGRCTLDTGARDSIGLYGPFIAAHPQVKPAALSALGVDGFGFGGPSFGQLGRLRSLRIGSFTLSSIIADFTADANGAFAAPFLAGNVGGGVWRRFTLTLDYSARSMMLTPNANYQAPDVSERAGLFLISHEGRYVVLDVRPGTPAAQAGVAKDDVLESVNGVSTSTMSLQAVRNLFLGAAGVQISLGLVNKDGARRTVVLTLRTFV